MSLDQVIKKDWQGPPGSKEGKGGRTGEMRGDGRVALKHDVWLFL